ncbi:allantoate amidohydrolase [Kushneria aurantia]|uniref:Allantoate amidohydrolase n=1 Tax=Kushneria aurantia TaxID=504092 RepID=A0ABV6G682_9GAMM|nr:allantoate amidohydrolase [Kushneria aurantia]
MTESHPVAGARPPLMDAGAILDACDALAALSASKDHIERVYLSAEHAAANRLAGEWMAAAGMTVWQDAVGNLCGRYEGREPELPALLLGSHLDTVVNAGRYDGILGVLLAIGVVARLHARGERLRHAVEVIAFADEEGTRYGTALFGSLAIAGGWQQRWWQLVGREGASLGEAFEQFGLDRARVAEAARPPGSVMAYLEAHIEQGPQLEDRDLPLGVVTSIAGARRFEISLGGRAGHAGTTPFALRHDALCGASEAVIAIEALARAADDVVATVGQLSVTPGAVNVIPAGVTMSLDIRSDRDTSRDRVIEAIEETIGNIADQRGLSVAWRETHSAPAVQCAGWLCERLDSAVEQAAGSSLRLASGAGHDGMAVAGLCDIAMLFVRCRGGLSHHPDESVREDDVAAALDAMGLAVRSIAEG